MSLLPDKYTGPGLVDLQVNGYAGFDFNSDPETWTAERFLRVKEALNRRGVLVALPTLITDDIEQMIARARKYAAIVLRSPQLTRTFPSLHIEGPFLSPENGPRGAHPLRYCRTPDDLPDFLNSIWEAAAGHIGLLTLAPELPGADRLIQEAAIFGIIPCIGHTQAGLDTISRAVDAGARLSTHLGPPAGSLGPDERPLGG